MKLRTRKFAISVGYLIVELDKMILIGITPINLYEVAVLLLLIIEQFEERNHKEIL